jgi:hypothetical protein
MRGGPILGSVAAIIFSGGLAAAADFDLVRGKVTHEYGHTKIALAIKNNTGKTVSLVNVNCGFYVGNELIDTGGAQFLNVTPNQVAYDTAIGDDENVTRIDCRISGVVP